MNEGVLKIQKSAVSGFLSTRKRPIFFEFSGDLWVILCADGEKVVYLQCILCDTGCRKMRYDI